MAKMKNKSATNPFLKLSDAKMKEQQYISAVTINARLQRKSHSQAGERLKSVI